MSVGPPANTPAAPTYQPPLSSSQAPPAAAPAAPQGGWDARASQGGLNVADEATPMDLASPDPPAASAGQASAGETPAGAASARKRKASFLGVLEMYDVQAGKYAAPRPPNGVAEPSTPARPPLPWDSDADGPQSARRASHGAFHLFESAPVPGSASAACRTHAASRPLYSAVSGVHDGADGPSYKRQRAPLQRAPPHDALGFGACAPLAALTPIAAVRLPPSRPPTGPADSRQCRPG